MEHAVQTQLSEQDYLEGEGANPIRHEYVAGEVFAMAGDSVDVREKWAAYRGLASLRYYLLVDSERLWAKVFFRDAHDAWFEQELSADDRIDVAYDGTRLTLTLDDLYEDTGLLVV